MSVHHRNAAKRQNKHSDMAHTHTKHTHTHLVIGAGALGRGQEDGGLLGDDVLVSRIGRALQDAHLDGRVPRYEVLQVLAPERHLLLLAVHLRPMQAIWHGS